jgi:hypothetical protein
VNRMSVVQAKIQTLEEIYRLVWTAVASKRSIEARYHEHARLFCPHRLGRNREGQLRALCHQYGGESESGLQAAGSPANWRCIVLEKLTKVRLLEDAWRKRQTTPVPHLALSTLTLMPRIRQSAIHKRGSKGVGRAGTGQSGFAASRSSSEYTARGERDEPRGRKFGGGEGADNLTWPIRAEGGNGSAH